VLRLITLGGLALTQDGEPYTGGASQRRRLAVLAVLAASGSAGLSRDKMLGYLWPEFADDQARTALNQAVHQIRQAIGADAITSTNTGLCLNASRVESDVAQFAQAMAERAYERAAALYRGPFLDGIHLRNAPEFERWVDAERARLAREYAVALESLAASAAARRDRAGVVRWRERLAAINPLNAPAIVALIEAHVALGDRVAARATATAHAALVREELGGEPEPAVRDWIARLKTEPHSQPAVAPGPAHEPTSGSAEPPRSAVGRGWGHPVMHRATGGRYAIGRLLASTDVLTTFAATDGRDGTAVALHVVNTRLVVHADPEQFVRTLQRVTAIGDPRVVPVLEVAATDECFCFVTPSAGGQSLRDRLAREHQLAVPDALRVAHDMAAALAAAHAHGVIHGDLRPKHVSLLDSGAVIAGWALFEALTPARHSDGWSVIETAVTIAAPGYASPEQLAGGAIPDERSDIYSVGCILFEMLAGKPPFAAGDPRTLIGRKLTQPPPSVREARDGVPDALDAVLRTCLARSPADRYASGTALTDALSGVGWK
jgi:DNA-binding SARP family transcriptional activator